MNPVPESKRYTPEEYLRRERAAAHRSQLVNGYIYAMSGASRSHNLIGGNILAELHAQLEGQSCEVHAHDYRVFVKATAMFTYPDVMVACPPFEFIDDAYDTLLNPSVIVEVLSPSTERFDRVGKFEGYRQIPALQHYVIVCQDRMSIECHTRGEPEWRTRYLTSPSDVLDLPAIGCRIFLERTYRRVNFAESGSATDLAVFPETSATRSDVSLHSSCFQK